MEKKTKYRLLGILIVTGLVVISLPLFQSETKNTTDVALVKAPPFPDSSSTKVTTILPGEEDIVVDTVQPVVASAVPQPMPDSSNVINSASSSIAKEEQSPSIKEVSPVPDKAVLASLDRDTEIKETKKILKSSSIVKSITKKPYNTKSTPVAIKKEKITSSKIDNNGLLKLKNASWVVQMGSFTNKVSALRLVNQLRANGYKAFIQQISTSFGTSTRVFVGPEYQQTTARELAQRLEKELHIRGMVISYKPLTL